MWPALLLHRAGRLAGRLDRRIGTRAGPGLPEVILLVIRDVEGIPPVGDVAPAPVVAEPVHLVAAVAREAGDRQQSGDAVSEGDDVGRAVLPLRQGVRLQRAPAVWAWLDLDQDVAGVRLGPVELRLDVLPLQVLALELEAGLVREVVRRRPEGAVVDHLQRRRAAVELVDRIRPHECGRLLARLPAREPPELVLHGPQPRPYAVERGGGLVRPVAGVAKVLGREGVVPDAATPPTGQEDIEAVPVEPVERPHLEASVGLGDEVQPVTRPPDEVDTLFGVRVLTGWAGQYHDRGARRQLRHEPSNLLGRQEPAEDVHVRGLIEQIVADGARARRPHLAGGTPLRRC